MHMLLEHFTPEHAVLIRGLPLGSSRMTDSLGWHFTKSRKYSVKSGYDAERSAKQRCQVSRFGLDIYPLLAGVWRVAFPPKIKHFMWQVLSGCISVSANLNRRGIGCDSGCARCRADEETVNHAIFRCLPARQAWALAQVPVGPVSFPTDSLYANVDHFLGSANPGAQVAAFPWIMWYIWKARNARVFENIMDNPENVVRLAIGEASTWLQAQAEEDGADISPNPSAPSTRGTGRVGSLPNDFSGYRCFVDGSWKAGETFAGAGWVCSAATEVSPMKGAANFRQSLSPLHAEVEAFVYAMRCMIGHDHREVAFYTDCSDLVKMVSSPQDWPAFKTYLDDIKMDKKEFSSFSLSLISRNANVIADYLARQALAPASWSSFHSTIAWRLSPRSAFHFMMFMRRLSIEAM
ncbi:PREDICTED: uncharacterized protein LOC104779014 [Camelina sativa]|uniref:Uncharacterized protein LOC104779014 n=1 Tax=Camelina sativa TaxID=90675 RepID=A0ABM0YJ31_CAMSA|nr:PREDICTED: uncharacterized protein LOC104779014 [Camelina sativa]